MEVATTGDVAYKFNPGFQNAYLAKGIARFFQVAGKKFFDIAYFLVRISFGIMLILSVLAVIFIFIAIMLYSNRGGDNDRDDYGGGGFHFGFFDYLILRDLLTWGAYSTAGQPQNQQQRRRKSNFLFDCFSFLFGDGNPNADIEERKWTLIANAIRDHGGVITAEQLAPYTGASPTDEDAVLPTLVRFDGKPEVTEEGGIVYTFPSMQVSATTRDSHVSAPFLKEMRWLFVGPQAGSLIMVYALAGFNFLGTWWLFLQPSLHELWAASFAPRRLRHVIRNHSNRQKVCPRCNQSTHNRTKRQAFHLCGDAQSTVTRAVEKTRLRQRFTYWQTRNQTNRHCLYNRGK